jgi:ABC-2 type transport system permease protein
MLSGTLSPRASLPEFVQLLMLAAPTTHWAALGQQSSFAVVLPQYLALNLIARCSLGFR